MDDVEKSTLGRSFNLTAQTAKNFEKTVRCEEYQNTRLVHSKFKWKREMSQGAKTREQKDMSNMCGVSPAKYCNASNKRLGTYIIS